MTEPKSGARVADFVELTKPKVVSLIMFTAVVGMFLATPGMVPWDALLFGSLGIALAAASAAAINHVLDRRLDEKMARTRNRPLPQRKVSSRAALRFAAILAVFSMAVLVWRVNLLTAVLTFLSLIGYAVVYTVYLKHATPQNIVIGGAAGAAPPVLGWTSVTNSVDAHALLLFLIIFAWTPPHFWALAIHRRDDYAKAGVPMLPVTHGVGHTKKQVFFYTILLVLVTLLPWLTGMSGLLYLSGAVVLGGVFLYYAWSLLRTERPDLPLRTFGYSVTYLIGLFTALLVDHYADLLV